MGLVSQILEFSTSIGSLVVVNNEFTELQHRTGDAMLLKCESHASVMVTGSGLTLGRVRMCIISKPRSEGQAIRADFDDGRYVVHTNCGFASRDDANNQMWGSGEHDNHAIKIKVPLTNNVWAAISNDEAVSMTVSWLVRLFWLLI